MENQKTDTSGCLEVIHLGWGGGSISGEDRQTLFWERESFMHSIHPPLCTELVANHERHCCQINHWKQSHKATIWIRITKIFGFLSPDGVMRSDLNPEGLKPVCTHRSTCRCKDSFPSGLKGGGEMKRGWNEGGRFTQYSMQSLHFFYKTIPVMLKCFMLWSQKSCAEPWKSAEGIHLNAGVILSLLSADTSSIKSSQMLLWQPDTPASSHTVFDYTLIRSCFFPSPHFFGLNHLPLPFIKFICLLFQPQHQQMSANMLLCMTSSVRW